MHTPHAILAELDIPTLVIFDNDSGCGDRLRRKIENGGQGDPAVTEHKVAEENRSLLRYLGETEQDFPVGKVSEHVFVWDDTLETVLSRDWQAWETTRRELIASGRGVTGKHSATYALAAEECPEGPTGPLLEAVKAAQTLVP